MNYRVVFSPEAEEQLVALYGYIAAVASPDIAARYNEAIVSYCESLRTFPHRGTIRDDVMCGPACASPTTRSASLSPLAWTPSRFPSSVCSTVDRTTKRSCKKTSRMNLRTVPSEPLSPLGELCSPLSMVTPEGFSE